MISPMNGYAAYRHEDLAGAACAAEKMKTLPAKTLLPDEPITRAHAVHDEVDVTPRSGSRVTHSDLAKRGYVRVDLHVPPELVATLRKLARAESRRSGIPEERCLSAAIFSLLRAAEREP